MSDAKLWTIRPLMTGPQPSPLPLRLWVRQSLRMNSGLMPHLRSAASIWSAVRGALLTASPRGRSRLLLVFGRDRTRGRRRRYLCDERRIHPHRWPRGHRRVMFAGSLEPFLRLLHMLGQRMVLPLLLGLQVGLPNQDPRLRGLHGGQVVEDLSNLPVEVGAQVRAMVVDRGVVHVRELLFHPVAEEAEQGHPDDAECGDEGGHDLHDGVLRHSSPLGRTCAALWTTAVCDIGHSPLALPAHRWQGVGVPAVDGPRSCARTGGGLSLSTGAQYQQPPGWLCVGACL